MFEREMDSRTSAEARSLGERSANDENHGDEEVGMMFECQPQAQQRATGQYQYMFDSIRH